MGGGRGGRLADIRCMTAGRQTISQTKHWCTPPGLVASVRAVFGGSIGLDPCSNADAQVHADREYRLPERDGLTESWDATTIFVNPPYGTDKIRGTRIADWFAKMVDAAERGSEVIALVPVATNTGHWKQSVFPHASAVCFLSAPRLRFYLDGTEDPKGAPMACAVIYYGSRSQAFAEEFSQHGAVLFLHDAALPTA